jgi:hypothetical protein
MVSLTETLLYKDELIYLINYRCLNNSWPDDKWIREVKIVNSWRWYKEIVKLKSRIHKVQILNSLNWNRTFVNPVCWNRDFMKLKLWIIEFKKIKCQHRSYSIIAVYEQFIKMSLQDIRYCHGDLLTSQIIYIYGCLIFPWYP